jgi:prevent-host-death family protein
MSVSEAKIKLNRLVERVQENAEDVVITRNGRAAAILVNPDEYESWRETQEIRNDPELMREIRRGLRELGASKKRLSFADIFGESLT